MPPQNSEYLFLGLIVTFLILSGFVGSLMMRFRALHKRLALIESLKDSEDHL